ncbi:hypothetical protein B7494_g6383 [Chlorociboria aeruginascens]|nr:hypothetical protein B7494_g6383 [Chlorociboria aeruginascens]
MAIEQLPKIHRALVQHVKAEPLQVEAIPTPQPTPGSAIVKVIAANVVSYSGEVFNGKRKYNYPTPIVTGFSAVGRVAATGPDSTLLLPGRLVFVDCVIRGRDDPSVVMLSGFMEGVTEGSRKLIRGEWRDSTYAEYVKAPLENCIPLNEAVLCGNPKDGGLGYDVDRLAFISTLLVPYGGLRDMRLEAGETVIIAPATGGFGGSAVLTALAMGTKVIAMGRNAEALAKLKTLSRRVETVQITGNQEEEIAALQKFGSADAFLDISPKEASNSTHFKSAILSLRRGGRVSLMGGYLGDIAIPHMIVMMNSIKLHGVWMYTRDDIGMLMKMIESGVLGLGDKDGVSVVGTFPLEKWQEAFDVAAKNATMGRMVLLKPETTA